MSAVRGIAALPGAGALVLSPQLASLAWTCFKAGAFVFGSGLAIVPLLEGEAVGHHAWMTHSEFMDGLAIGQVTPGPVVITATFIGYKVAGWAGALVATIAIFAPCFFNVLVLLPRVLGRLERSDALPRFASFAIPSVIGCILGTAVRLGWLTLVSPLLAAVFVLAFAVGLRLRVPSWALIIVSGVCGALI